MESRTFIRVAADLITRIKIAEIGTSSYEEISERRRELQQEIDRTFSFLQNPTLPSAYRLRDVALENGYTVSKNTLQRLSQYENIT